MTELPREDQDRLKGFVGSKMVVERIDRFGFVWVAAEGKLSFFCLEPEELDRG